MNLFAGDLSFVLDKYSEAQKYYNNILSINPDISVFREELIRSYIGLGDSSFGIYKFLEAHNFYKKLLL